MPCSTLHELTWRWEVLTRQCGGYRDTPDTAHLQLAPGKGPAGRGGARGGARVRVGDREPQQPLAPWRLGWGCCRGFPPGWALGRVPPAVNP